MLILLCVFVFIFRVIFRGARKNIWNSVPSWVRVCVLELGSTFHGEEDRDRVREPLSSEVDIMAKKSKRSEVSKVVYKKISSLKPFPYMEGVFDPLSEVKRKELRRSIAERGLDDPITVWGDFIIAGHNRVSVCHSLEHDEIACIDRTDLSKEGAKLLFLESNLARREVSPKEKARAAAAMKEHLKAWKSQQRIEVGATGYPSGEEGEYPELEGEEDAGTSEKGIEKAVKAKNGASTPDIPKVLQKKSEGPSSVQEAADTMGVSRRQFDELAYAGSAPAEVVDAIGEGVSVKEAAAISRGMNDPEKAPEVEKAVEDFVKAPTKEEREAAKTRAVVAAKGVKEKPVQMKSAGALRAAYDPNKGKIQVILQPDPSVKGKPLLLLDVSGEVTQEGLEEAFDLAMSFVFTAEGEGQ